MRDTTQQDILDHLSTLRGFAYGLLPNDSQGEDWWDTLAVGDLSFDVNVFLWEEDGKQVKKVTAYPMFLDGNGYWKTNYSDFVPLLTQDLETGIVKEGA